MSDTEYVSTESSTDSEFERRLDQVADEKYGDEVSELIMEEMRHLGLRSNTLDGDVIKGWLSGDVTLADVVVCGRLRQQNSVVLKNYISEDRIAEIREFAKKVIDHYGGSLRYSSYVDRVAACIIRYEYRL